MTTQQGYKKIEAPTRVIGKVCSKSKQQLSTGSVGATNKYCVEDEQWVPPCPTSKEYGETDMMCWPVSSLFLVLCD